MALNSTQLSTLKADILADPAFASVPNNDDGHFQIAAAYNQLASPVFRVWRTDIPTRDVKKAINWTEYIGRNQGERDAFQLIISNGIVNAADSNIRQGFLDIFSGPSGATTRANLTALGKRDSTRAEKLFSTGIGSDASPATMGFEGPISFQDVRDARNL